MNNLKKALGIGLVYALMLVAVMCVNAQLPSTVDEASIAFGYSSVAGDTGLDIAVAVPYEVEMIEGYAAAITQRSDTVSRTKYHAEAGGTLIGDVSVNVYLNGLRKQYAGADAGYTNGLGIELVSPERAVGVFQVTGSVGVEGQNGGQIGAPNAGDILEGQNFDPEKLEALDLYMLTPNKTGLTLQQGTAFKGAISVALSHPSGITFDIKALPDVVSESEYKSHQMIVSASTSIEINDSFSLDIGFELGGQTSPIAADTLEFEHALFMGGKYTFN